MTRQEWTTEGERLFGPDQLKWRFVCPACGHECSIRDWKEAGATSGQAAFSCIGRYLPEKPRPAFGAEGRGPCNYAGGGLIGLNPVEVDGTRYFAFVAVPGELSS